MSFFDTGRADRTMVPVALAAVVVLVMAFYAVRRFLRSLLAS